MEVKDQFQKNPVIAFVEPGKNYIYVYLYLIFLKC